MWFLNVFHDKKMGICCCGDYDENLTAYIYRSRQHQL